MIKKIAIIIPSYNESKNIKILIVRIRKYINKSQIIIVDDSNISENNKIKKIVDGSGQNIHLLTRTLKLGRGSAVIDGLRYAFKNFKTEYFFEMDADLAHDPSDLNKFITEISKSKSSLVVGSRYLKTSKIVKWPLWRLFLSKAINYTLSFWLNLGISDYTNGYRLYNRKAVAFLLKTHLRENGFILLSEIAFKLRNNKFKISEVPITFTDRTRGKSSMGFSELIHSFFGAVRIKFSKS